MSSFKFETNAEGIFEFMKSQEVVNCLMQYANDYASRCDGEVANTYIGTTRANVSVRAENTDNSMLKAIRG